MIKRTICITLLFVLPAVSVRAGEIQADGAPHGYFEPANALRFADHLYENGDYLRAAGEYRRYLFQMDQASGTDSIFYRMTKAAFLGGDLDLSERLLGDLGRLYPRSPIAADIPLLTAIVKYAGGDYRGALGLLESEQDSARGLGRIVASMSCLKTGDPGSARLRACAESMPPRFVREDAGEAEIRILAYICGEAESAGALPSRSGPLAGTMSALLPGAGKIYCERYSDGVYAFLTVGLLAWGAYEGFDEDGWDSTKGWVFGVLGGSLYLGNIYGSYISAGIYNKRVYDEFLRGVIVEITFP